MKIKVSDTHLKKVKSLRDELSTTQDELLKKHQEFSRLSKLHASLKKEIEVLETSANFDKKEEVQALGQKRIELDLINSRLSKIPGLGQEQIDPIQSLLRQTGYALTAALMPSLESKAAEIAKIIRPFCPDDNWAIHHARQLPASMSLGAYCSPPLGRTDFNPRFIQEAITRCDEVLAGELAWEFNPNPA